MYMHWVRCHHTAKFEISPILLALVWRRIAQVNDHKISGYIIWYTKYVPIACSHHNGGKPEWSTKNKNISV